MRGNPEKIDAAVDAREFAARDRYASERESYRAEAEADADAAAEAPTPTCPQRLRFGASDVEVEAFRAGVHIGRKDERNRIATALDALERKAASLFFEGTPSQRAVAQYVAEVRRVVEGGT